MRYTKMHPSSLSIGERTAVEGMSNRLGFMTIPLREWFHDLASVRLFVVHILHVVNIHAFVYGVCPVFPRQLRWIQVDTPEVDEVSEPKLIDFVSSSSATSFFPLKHPTSSTAF
jgi:hypothetical protein